MSLFILRFWPVILPLLAYLWWYIAARRKAIRAEVKPPHFREGPWFWSIIASLAIGLLIFLALGLANAPNSGEYVPPRFEKGQIIPGHLEK